MGKYLSIFISKHKTNVHWNCCWGFLFSLDKSNCSYSDWGFRPQPNGDTEWNNRNIKDVATENAFFRASSVNWHESGKDWTVENPFFSLKCEMPSQLQQVKASQKKRKTRSNIAVIPYIRRILPTNKWIYSMFDKYWKTKSTDKLITNEWTNEQWEKTKTIYEANKTFWTMWMGGATSKYCQQIVFTDANTQNDSIRKIHNRHTKNWWNMIETHKIHRQ